jgi:hypothetical protein
MSRPLRPLLLLLATCGLAACAGIQPGGQYSGIPDTRTGNTRQNMETGSITTSGAIFSNRDGYLTTPAQPR